MADSNHFVKLFITVRDYELGVLICCEHTISESFSLILYWVLYVYHMTTA